MENKVLCSSCRYDYLRDREKELNISTSNADFLIRYHAHFMKLAAGRIKWKSDDYLKKKHKRPKGEIRLIPEDIKSLHILQGKIAQYLKETSVDIGSSNNLSECFLRSTEGDALEYFDKNLSGTIIHDDLNMGVLIPEDSYQFMYKDDAGNHIVASQNYKAYRGQRLPYIPHVIRLSKCVLERPYRYDYTESLMDRMYLHSFVETRGKNSEENRIYMAVIVLRDRKGNKKTFFKTAFPIANDMDLCRRLSGGYAFIEKK